MRASATIETTAGRAISTVSATFNSCIWSGTGFGSSSGLFSGTGWLLSEAGWDSGWTVGSTSAFAETIPAVLGGSDAGIMAWLFVWTGLGCTGWAGASWAAQANKNKVNSAASQNS